MVEAVGRLANEARHFFYRMMLHGRACPRCGEPRLIMIREGRFQCQNCGHADDPTLIYQRCRTCDGELVLISRRYQCRRCGEHVDSEFLYDSVVYDAEYFRRRMAESRDRQRQAKQAENERQAGRAWQRSSPITETSIDLSRSPGLIDALDAMIQGASPESVAWARTVFDLAAYEKHILHLLEPGDMRVLTNLPGLGGTTSRLECIRNFIACLFLEHAGLIDLDQRCGKIWVSLRETD